MATGHARGGRRWTKQFDEGAGRVDDVRADEGVGVEEDGPTVPCWCYNQSGGGQAGDTALGRKSGRRRLGSGYRSGGGRASDATPRRKRGPRRSGGDSGVKSSRAVAVGCKRVTVDVKNNRAVAFGRRRGATGGRVGWGGGGNSRSGRTSGRERECGRTRDRARARGGYVPTFRRLPVS
jgi:hypothetical protein